MPPLFNKLIEGGKLPVVGTFQAAGAIPLHLFHNFGGRVGLLANQPADKILEAADLEITIGYDLVGFRTATSIPRLHRERAPHPASRCPSLQAILEPEPSLLQPADQLGRFAKTGCSND